MNLIKSPLKIFASLKAVIALFLYLSSKERNSFIAGRVASLSEAEVHDALKNTIAEFKHRHRDLEHIFSDHFQKINGLLGNACVHYSEERKLLLGAYFTKEYSIQAAALFNPSIVPHPDQSNLNTGEQRFVMSLRATGEGHISSLCFQTGLISQDGKVTLDKEPEFYTRLKKSEAKIYTRQFLKHSSSPAFDEIISSFPEQFTEGEAIQLLEEIGTGAQVDYLREALDKNYDLENSFLLPINEKVIFPFSAAEKMGMEDVRFVKFNDAGNTCYYGTYTAYNGNEINTHMIETIDFNSFKIRTLNGSAISDKGMALFPEKIKGKYAMISRQGAEKLSIMFSDDLYQWNNYALLMEPVYPWEIVQIGNCGSPVKTEKGWLLLTHGVGAVRKYVISAILLDLEDPSIIIGRMDKPFLSADENEREGYVPNVVYTCGCLLHGSLVIIPYAVSDFSICFATLDINELLLEMKPENQ
ncbi:MAG: glycoside hydrolase family 130 protein [Ferruginibacter sp.]